MIPPVRMPQSNAAQTPRSLSAVTVCSWLILLIVAGAYIRIEVPLHYPYGNDEAMHIGMASGSSLSDVLRYSLYEVHPPLFYILLHYWMKISAAPEFVRCLSLVFGMALIPLYYCIGVKLSDRLSGLCCATLMTLSYGCIVQSYLVRSYGLLVFLLSLNFYFYLHWRDSHKKTILLAYILVGWLAVSNHFSAVFYFACIAAFETVALLRGGAGRSRIMHWLLANLAILALAVILYRFWQPAIVFYSSHNPGIFFPYPSSIRHLVTNTLSAPFYAAYYIYPPIPLLFIMMLYAFLSPQFASDKQIALRPYLAVAGIACLLSMAIYILRLYPPLGTRHSLWMVPLLLPAMGVMVADLLERATVSLRHRPIRATLLLLAYSAVCDMGVRSGDDEYSDWQRGPWQTILQTLDTLGSRDVIITDKSGLNLLTNMYLYKSNETLVNGTVPVLAPYRNTHILIGPEYFGNYSAHALHDMMETANANHLFENVDRFVFVKLWMGAPFYDLMLCDKYPKQIFYPLLPPGMSLDRNNFPLTYRTFGVTAVLKTAFLSDVLSVSGKAASCLDTKNDKITGDFIAPSAKRSLP